MSHNVLRAYEWLLSTKRCGDVWIFYQLILSMYRVALDWSCLWFKNTCCCSVAQSCLTLGLHELQHARLLSFTISWSLLKLMSIESVMPFNLYHPLLLPSIFPSIRVFSYESLRLRWPKYWSFSFSISPSNEYPRLKNIYLPRKFPGEGIY